MLIIGVEQFVRKELELVYKMKKVVARRVEQEADKILCKYDGNFGQALNRNRQLLLLIQLGEAAMQDGVGTQMSDQGGQQEAFDDMRVVRRDLIGIQ